MDLNIILNNREDLIGIRWEEIKKLYVEISTQYNVPPELLVQLHHLVCAQIEHDRQHALDHFRNEIKKIAEKR